MAEEALDGGGGDAGADEHREAGGGSGFGEVVGIGWPSGGGTGDDDAVGAEELGSGDGVGKREVGGEGVAGVFLFDVGEDGDVLGADGAAVAKEGAGLGLGHEAFVGDVGEGEVLDADELGPDGEGDGEGLAGAEGEDLHAHGGVADGVGDGEADGGHGCGDGGMVGGVDVGGVVHVLDHDRVEARGDQHAGLVGGGLGQSGDGLPAAGAAGEGPDVDHADEGFVSAEDLVQCGLHGGGYPRAMKLESVPVNRQLDGAGGGGVVAVEPGRVSAPTRAKIVATLGPASDSPEMIERLIMAGVAVFRLNLSHGKLEDHHRRITTVREVAAKLGLPVGVLGDLPGPKIRIGTVPGEGIELHAGQDVLLAPTATESKPGRTPVLSCGYATIGQDVLPGQRVLVNDGAIRMLAVERAKGDPAAALRCRVTTGGLVTSGKGINLPQSDLSVTALSDRDWACVQWAVQHGVDYLALSFVRTADEIRTLQEYLAGVCPASRAGEELLLGDGAGKPSMIPVIAKIEKPQAVANMDAIVKQADGIMVARGDLGVEMDIALVPVVQKQLVAAADNWGKPCIVATQMLESMISSPGPTRAEVTDVANAVFDGADAVMLSGETAVGKYPLVTVETMRRVIDTAEKRITELRHDPSPPRRVIASGYRTAALAHAAWYLARDMHAKAVVVWSQTGGGARYLSQTNFTVPIIAYSSSRRELRRMALLKGVRALRYDLASGSEHDLAAWNRTVDEELQTLGIASKGDIVVLLAGRPLGEPRVTNQMVVHEIGNPSTGFLAEATAGRG